jgi:calcineurin-like phosphoesterase family protein
VTDIAPPSAPAAHESSRTSASGAGWHCQQQGTFRQLEPPGRRPKFSWLRPSVLWAARNDPLARLLDDPTDETRRRWVEEQRNRGADPDFRIDRSDLATYSCLIAGDTGEGDHSQYAVVPAITKIGEGTAFMVLLSDVIYPIGNVNEYVDKFYRPYSRYSAPVYAVPGNHDWYDGLGGFMRHFCGADPLEILRVRRRVFSRDGIRDRLWRKPSVLEGETMERAHEFRPAPDQRLGQPGPYWILDTGPVQFVGVDTGIIGNLDGDQGDWLKRVSAGPKPKILVTGKPLVVNDGRDPGRIADRDFTVDDVVRDPANNYVAAIGGDIHNYQHYPIRVGDRTIHYVVNGGGGAFMHATHTIPKASVEGVNEDDFKCYPLRGDSLAFYSRLYSRKLTFGSTLLEIEPKQASALLASRRETVPTRPGGPGKPTTATRLKGLVVGLLPSGRTFHKYLSEFADWDDPPLFKSFLRLDVTADAVRIRCFAASGCLDQELNPPVEDDFTIELGRR